MMFPSNQYKTTITLFTPYQDNLTSNVRFFRTVLTRCFWNADSLTVTRAGGTAAPEQVDLNIPLKYNPGYINRNDWVRLSKLDLADKWSIRIGGDNTNRSVILRGDVEYPALEVWQDSEALGRVFTAFTREFGGQLHFPTNTDEIMYGLGSMWRVAVAC